MGHILISGGAGFIGSHLTEKLVEEGHNIIVVDNLSRGNLGNLSNVISEIEFVRGDITNYDLMKELVKNADVSFHLASLSRVMPSIQNPELCFKVNVQGTEIVARLCSKYNRRIIFSSSREVYGTAQYIPVDEEHPLHPENPYGASKVSGEKIIEAYSKCFGLDYSILRLANVYGERDFDRVIPLFIEKALKNEDLVVYGGEQILDFVHIKDVIRAFLKASEISENIMINIGSGEGVKIVMLAKTIKELTKSKSKIILEKKRKGEVERFIANRENAKRSLGWTLETSLREGVSRLLKSSHQ